MLVTPVFAAAFLIGSHAALVVGIATALGAGISMALSEALSDDGKTTERGHPTIRGLVTGVMTAIGGIFHAVPFLIPDKMTAIFIAGIVMAVELTVIVILRRRFLHMRLSSSFLQVVLGGLASSQSESSSAFPEPSHRRAPVERELGYEIEPIKGLGGGYRTGGGARLPPMLFDEDQVIAIAVALQTARSALAGIEQSSARVLTTVRQVMPERLWIELDAFTVSLVPNYWEFPAAPIDAAVVRDVGAAVRRRHILRADYADGEGEPARLRREPPSADRLGCTLVPRRQRRSSVLSADPTSDARSGHPVGDRGCGDFPISQMPQRREQRGTLACRPRHRARTGRARHVTNSGDGCSDRGEPPPSPRRSNRLGSLKPQPPRLDASQRASDSPSAQHWQSSVDVHPDRHHPVRR